MTEDIARPGKVIAVHLSYASRADQRGRRPAHPSYFLKPSSSVAASGGRVERPSGTELLAFEGEIALIIGAPARRVSVSDAWAHVAWITAANDLGLYDLRAADKGSNVRSKGGDGYTPLGPGLIAAASVDPSAVRVRTWVNGELRQEDTTAGLIFPLAQIVADLSQHFTLETGDAILTGTPAGSSVIVPGDVVEVEVDAGGASSGRLVTTVVQGDAPFDAALGSLPAADEPQRAEAWGTPVDSPAARSTNGEGDARSTDGEDTARSIAPARSLSEERSDESKRPRTETRFDSPAARSTDGEGDTRSTDGEEGARSTNGEGDARSTNGEEGARSTNGEEGARHEGTLTQALRAKLLAAPTAGLSAQLRRRGMNACVIEGVTANRPGVKIVGTAKTLRFVPAREDLFASHGGGYNAQKRVFDEVWSGEVVVIEARGERGSGTLGDILALRAKARGAAGVVTDGGVRDFDAVAEIGLPVFSNGAHPAVLGRRHVPWDSDITIACGGATVQPGDIIVGDGDGVIVIPPSLAEDIADAALAQEDEDAWIAEQVAAGHPVDGLFPMNAEWRARYDASREDASHDHDRASHEEHDRASHEKGTVT
ncbi:fumarylacetoacetate hydrolase family protein [Microbacterium tumbae]